MPAILATQEPEDRRIIDQNQFWNIVCDILSQKQPSQERNGVGAQGVGPEFKPQYLKTKIQ
jgi:hypothetical protein